MQISLLARTNVVLGLAAVAIAAVSVIVVNRTVIEPISERSAENRAALLVLTAREWAQVATELRHDFEVEVLMNSGIIVANPPLQIPPSTSISRYYESLVQSIETLTGRQVQVREADDLLWVDVPVSASQFVQVGFASELRDVQEVYVGVVLLVAGALILLLTSFLLMGRVVAPLVHVANEAASFRATAPFTALPEAGPKELRTLVRSFNQMAQDVTDLLSNRTVLLAGISHDLRTPLARMRLNLELIRDRLESSEVDRLSNNIQQMEDLISQALEFVHESREVSRTVQIRDFMTEVVTAFDPEIDLDFKGVNRTEMQIARGALKRVLENLLANASEHAENPSVLVKATSEQLVIRVIDSGPGIPEEHRKEVFQPFFRLEGSRTRKTGGSGLGLAVVAQLCHAHSWNIRISDAAGRGTVVILKIPLI